MVQTFAPDSRMPVPDGMSENDPNHPTNVMRNAQIAQNQAVADTKYDPYPPKRLTKEESEQKEKEAKMDELRRRGIKPGSFAEFKELHKGDPDLIPILNGDAFYKLVKQGTGAQISVGDRIKTKGVVVDVKTRQIVADEVNEKIADDQVIPYSSMKVGSKFVFYMGGDDATFEGESEIVDSRTPEKPIPFKEFKEKHKNDPGMIVGDSYVYKIITNGTGESITMNSMITYTSEQHNMTDPPFNKYIARNENIPVTRWKGSDLNDEFLNKILLRMRKGSVFVVYSAVTFNDKDSTNQNTWEILDVKNGAKEGFGNQSDAAKDGILYAAMFGLIFAAVFFWKQGKGRGLLKGRARPLATIAGMAVAGLVLYRLFR
jgi:hypothetical protein